MAQRAGREVLRQTERAKHAVALDGMLGEECKRLEAELDTALQERATHKDEVAKIASERYSETCVLESLCL